MKRYLKQVAVGLVLLLTGGCAPLLLPLPLTGSTPTAIPLAALTAPLSPTAPGTSIALPTPAPTATELATSTPGTAWLTGEVEVYPGPLHYSGDVLSVEVALQNSDKIALDQVQFLVDGKRLDVKPFVSSSPLRNDVLAFRWAWDTTGVTGLHDVAITLPRNGSTAVQNLVTHVDILPSGSRPDHESGEMWAIRNSACCKIYYVTRTAAARDIATIDDRATQATVAVEKKTGFPISNKPIPLVMIDNVWGNGAYASDNVVISYVDRFYIGLDLDIVLRHEFTHWAMEPVTHNTPVMLVEGTAVYVAGGHYKPEPLPERGAALLASGLYIPLAELADNFRARQHEIAYLEAGALVQYLAETYTWPRFVNVYSTEGPEGSATEWLNTAFKAHYDKTLDEVEADFRTWLGKRAPGEQVEDLRLSIDLLDTVRQYQATYAPYQEALPTIKDAFDKRAVAEFVREPTEPQNIALEAMLVTAGQNLRSSQYGSAQVMLDAVKQELSGGVGSTLYDDYLSITILLATAGYEAQRIDVAGDQATVLAIRRWPTIEVIRLSRVQGNWQIQP